MRKSILFILPSLGSGGAERQAVTIACLLKKNGYEVSFWCYFEDNFYEKSLVENGIRVNRKVCNYLRRIHHTTRFIRKGNFDVVISFMHTPNFLNDFAAMFGKKWRVITSIRINPTEKMFASRTGKINAWFQRYSDAIVCNAEDSANNYAKFQPKEKEKLTTVYNTVTLGKIDTSYIPRKNGKTNIVVAATIDHRKNPMGVLSAIELLTPEERQNIHIDWYGRKGGVIGDQTEYEKVVEVIKEKKLEEVIEFHDATSDIANRMNEADCVALFSSLEGLPNAICEGMMIGKPIVMSRVSDYWHLVEEGVNGYLCDWDNVDSIRLALSNIAGVGDEKLLAMGRASKEKAEKMFSQEAILKKWIDVIEG